MALESSYVCAFSIIVIDDTNIAAMRTAEVGAALAPLVT